MLKIFEMRLPFLLIALCLTVGTIYAQNQVKLLLRIDDIGYCKNSNEACIYTYTHGIAQSVELMAPCPWFEDAADMLNEHPDLDVGVHLVLTSEWDHYKWRPLTNGPSLITADGYFRSMTFPNENYPSRQVVQGGQFNIDEVELEMRAQIECALKKVPHITHITDHMLWSMTSPEMANLYRKLGEAYNLKTDFDAPAYLPLYTKGQGDDVAIESFIHILSELKPGTYMFAEHPGYNTPEAQGISHIGYENVAEDREQVTRVLTSEKVKAAIKALNIQLISYKDL